MATLQLSFYGEHAELVKTTFCHKALGINAAESVRGKDGFAGGGSFQWSRGVKALCLVAIKHKLKAGGGGFSAQLTGVRGSLAASLDNAIHKKCLWLIDMFGCDANGNMLASRLLKRSNPGLRRAGPVHISINSKLLPPDSIIITRNGEEISSREELSALCSEIEPDAFTKSHLRLVTNG